MRCRRRGGQRPEKELTTDSPITARRAVVVLLVVGLPALVIGVLTRNLDWAGFVAIVALVVLGAWWLLQDESEELEGNLSHKGVREGRSFRFRLRD